MLIKRNIAVFCLLVFAATAVFAQRFTIDIAMADFEAQQIRDRTFKDYVESASGGRIAVNLLSRQAIVPGGDQDVVEMLQSGELTIGSPAETGMGILFPDIEAINLPFLIPNVQVGAALLAHDSPYFRRLALEVYSGSGGRLRLIGAHVNSLRHLYTMQPIRTPNDLRRNNVTIRVQEVPLILDMWRALGASPIGLPPADRYMALETGMIQALEGGVASVEGVGGFEILRSITLTGHQFSADYMMINEAFFQSLPNDLKKIVLDGAQRAAWMASANREYYNIRALEQLRAQGIGVISLTSAEHRQWEQLAVRAARGYLEERITRSFLDYTIRTVAGVRERMDANVEFVGSVR